MPLRNCPFLKLSEDDIPRPILPIKIINPHTGLSYATFGGKYRGRIKHLNLKGIVDGEWLKG